MAKTENNVKVDLQQNDPWKKKRSIAIPRLNGSREQPDIIASVNGRVFQIQRGTTVEVPEPIYEVLQRSFEAEAQAEIDYYNKANPGNA